MHIFDHMAKPAVSTQTDTSTCTSKHPQVFPRRTHTRNPPFAHTASVCFAVLVPVMMTCTPSHCTLTVLDTSTRNAHDMTLRNRSHKNTHLFSLAFPAEPIPEIH
ncbi:unnamed protein product, partial [Ectocarpus sp. 12 AP-2014]